jgi:hypothetical protein
LQGAIGLAPIDAHEAIKQAVSDYPLDAGLQFASFKFVEAMAWAAPDEDAPTSRADVIRRANSKV